MGLFSTLSFRKRSQPLATAVGPEPMPEAIAASAEAPALEPSAPAAPVEEPLVPTESLPAPPAPNAAARAQAERLVQRVVYELPTFITVAVVEAANGNILAGQWAGHSGGAVEVAIANAEIVRQTRLAIDALQLTATEQLTDILFTLRHQLHVLRVLPQSDWLLYLAVHTRDTNPALARSVTQMLDN